MKKGRPLPSQEEVKGLIYSRIHRFLERDRGCDLSQGRTCRRIVYPRGGIDVRQGSDGVVDRRVSSPSYLEFRVRTITTDLTFNRVGDFSLLTVRNNL